MQHRTIYKLFTPFAFCILTSTLTGQVTNFTEENISGISLNTNQEADKFIAAAEKYKLLNSIEVGQLDSAHIAAVFQTQAAKKITHLVLNDPPSEFPYALLKEFKNLEQAEVYPCKAAEKFHIEKIIDNLSSYKLSYFSFSVIDKSLIPDNLGFLHTVDSVNIDIIELCNQFTDENTEYTLTLKRQSGEKVKTTITDFNKSLLKEERDEIKEAFTSSSSYQLPAKKQIRNIEPPVKGAEVPAETYTLNAKAGGTFVYSKSGTTLTIPPNAFVDERGKIVKGEVRLDYKEYRNPEEIIVSGIPMSINKGGESGNMESAGMFDIGASANGKEVYLAQNKQIEVALMPTDTLKNGYNFYAYDPQKGEWSNKGNFSAETEKITKEQKTNGSSPDSVIRYEFSIASRLYRQMIMYPEVNYDTLSFAERFKSPKHEYTFHENVKSRKLKIKRHKCRRANNLVKLRRLRTNKQGEVLCDLRYYHKSHPELSAFAGLSWKISDTRSASEMRNELTSRKKYNDIRIEQSNGEYVIRLKYKDGIAELTVRPVRVNERDSVLELKDGGNKKYQIYKKKLHQREKIFNRKLKLRTLPDNQYLVIPDRQLRQEMAYEKALPLMTEEEKRMSKRDWTTAGFYIQRKVPATSSGSQSNFFYDDRTGRPTLNGVAVGVIRLATLGLFNCDRLIAPERPVEVYTFLPEFRNETNEKLNVTHLYVVYRKGVVIKYNPEEALRLRKNSKAGFILVTTDGKVAVKEYGPVNDFCYDSKSKITLGVKEIDVPIRNPQQLKQYTNF